MIPIGEAAQELVAKIEPQPTDEARLRCWRYWAEIIRPQMRLDKHEPYGPFEPPDEKVERLRRTFWNELPIVIGPGLAAKFPGWAESLRALEKCHASSDPR